jgi:hypothetical protein
VFGGYADLDREGAGGIERPEIAVYNQFHNESELRT